MDRWEGNYGPVAGELWTGDGGIMDQRWKLFRHQSLQHLVVDGALCVFWMHFDAAKLDIAIDYDLLEG